MSSATGSSTIDTIDSYIQALLEYLRSKEWSESIRMFVDANCYLFQYHNEEKMEYTHEHYNIWKTFQEIVEQILEMTLSNIGGNINILEKAFDKILKKRTSTGPREDAIKDILEQLLTYDSFHHFSAMMHTYSKSESYNKPVHPHYNDLLCFGFNQKDVDDAVNNPSNQHASLEELVILLSTVQQQSPVQSVKQLSLPIQQKQTQQHQQQQSSSSLFSFSKIIDEDCNELTAKFMMAKSVVETFDASNHLTDGLIVMLQWATNMIHLKKCIQRAYNSNTPYHAVTNDHPEGLVEWYSNLEDLRRELELEEVTSNMIGDSEIQRLSDLNNIAAMGTEDEQLLHTCITRYDEVQKQINNLHRVCAGIEFSGVKKEVLEEVYLYLKEKVISGDDLSSIIDEMHEKVYSHVSPSQAVEVINVLLEMHTLEDEQYMLKYKIDSLLSRSVDTSIHVFDSNSSSISTAAESKDDYYRGSGSGSIDDKADSKSSDRNSDKDERMKSSNSSSSSSSSNDYLDTLKTLHKSSLLHLKESIDNDRLSTLRKLEVKLKKRKADISSDGSDSNASNDNIVIGILSDIAATNGRYDILKEGIISGYKKRCISEMKASKSKGGMLNDNDKMIVYKDAVEQIKAQHQRDYQAMLNAIQVERDSKRKKLKSLLDKRKAGNTNSMGDDGDEELELQRIDELYDNQIAEMTSRNQLDSLLNISSIMISDELIAVKRDSTQDHDEDDRYLDDTSNSKSNSIVAWMADIEAKTNEYVSAGLDLQTKLKNNLEGSDNDDIYEYMNNLIVDAYTRDVQHLRGNSTRSSSSSSGDTNEATKRYILQQFERSQSDYDGLMEAARKKSRACLTNRKGANTISTPTSSVTDVLDIVDKCLSSPSKSNAEGAAGSSPSGNRKVMNNLYTNNSMPMIAKPKAGVVLPSLKHAGTVSNSSSLQPLNKLSPIGKQFLDTSTDSDNNEDIKKSMVRKYQEKEVELIDSLRSQMDQKKKVLEARLQKKRADKDRMSVESAIDDRMDRKDINQFVIEDVDDDLRTTQKEIDALDDAFKKVVSIVQTDYSSRVDQLNTSILMQAVDSIMNGEEVNGLVVDPRVRQVRRQSSSKDHLQDEAKRIAMTYTEEKQKLDLMMKLQQTRQKQALQRKLLDRNHRHTSSSNKEDDDEDEDPDDLPLVFLSPRSSNTVESMRVKGLYPESVGRSAYNSPTDYATRGLNLGPLHKK